MNSPISFIIADWVTNLTSNPFKYGFEPYTSLIGNTFYALFFGFIGGAIYMGTGNTGATLVYFLLCGIFMALVIPSVVLAIFGILSGLIIASILYYALIEKRSI
jgi:hypothetical protein